MHHHPIPLLVPPGLFDPIAIFALARFRREDDVIWAKRFVEKREFLFTGMLSANPIVTHGSPFPFPYGFGYWPGKQAQLW